MLIFNAPGEICHSHFFVFFCQSRPKQQGHETSDPPFAADKELIHSFFNTGHAFFLFFRNSSTQLRETSAAGAPACQGIVPRKKLQ